MRCSWRRPAWPWRGARLAWEDEEGRNGGRRDRLGARRRRFYSFQAHSNTQNLLKLTVSTACARVGVRAASAWHSSSYCIYCSSLVRSVACRSVHRSPAELSHALHGTRSDTCHVPAPTARLARKLVGTALNAGGGRGSSAIWGGAAIATHDAMWPALHRTLEIAQLSVKLSTGRVRAVV